MNDEHFWVNVFEQLAEDVKNSDWQPVMKMLSELPTEVLIDYLTRGPSYEMD